MPIRLPGDGITYFIQGEKTGLIKIGMTVRSCPCERYAALQASSPDKLLILGLIRGNHERKLHQRFSDSRSHGEWFHPSSGLLDFINAETQKLNCECIDRTGYFSRTLTGDIGAREVGGSAEQNRHNKHRGLRVPGCSYCEKRQKWTPQKVARTKKRLNRSRNGLISTIYGKKADIAKKCLDNTPA